MSSQDDQQAIWTPPVIATIVYRVVMIIVSIAFIWKKYRRPARVPRHVDEEQLIGVVLPTFNSPIHRPRSANGRQRRTPPTYPGWATTLREVIVASLEDTIQSALGLDDDDGATDEPRISFDAPSIPSARHSAEVSSLDTDAGLDIDLGDMGLRHRLVDSISDNKKTPRHPS